MKYLLFLFLFGCTAAVCNHNMKVSVDRLIGSESVAWLESNACGYKSDYYAGCAYVDWIHARIQEIGVEDYGNCLGDAWYAEEAVKKNKADIQGTDKWPDMNSVLMRRAARFRLECPIAGKNND